MVSTYTLSDIQRRKLDKLMQNIDNPIEIPSKKEANFPDPPDFVRNVMGSSAGAGSGEFHVYRHLRRKEYARLRFIEEQAKKEELNNAYKAKLEENQRLAEEKTAKKRMKRQKKKQRQMELKKLKQETHLSDERTNGNTQTQESQHEKTNGKDDNRESEKI